MSDCETGGGRRRRKADTELKTKTPHVNVGNSMDFELKLIKVNNIVVDGQVLM